VSWTADDWSTEQVESLLDPKHFELSLTYGEAGR
jgi:GntR family transcriptional regulator